MQKRKNSGKNSNKLKQCIYWKQRGEIESKHFNRYYNQILGHFCAIYNCFATKYGPGLGKRLYIWGETHRIRSFICFWVLNFLWMNSFFFLHLPITTLQTSHLFTPLWIFFYSNTINMDLVRWSKPVRHEFDSQFLWIFRPTNSSVAIAQEFDQREEKKKH